MSTVVFAIFIAFSYLAVIFAVLALTCVAVFAVLGRLSGRRSSSQSSVVFVLGGPRRCHSSSRCSSSSVVFAIAVVFNLRGRGSMRGPHPYPSSPCFVGVPGLT